MQFKLIASLMLVVLDFFISSTSSISVTPTRRDTMTTENKQEADGTDVAFVYTHNCDVLHDNCFYFSAFSLTYPRRTPTAWREKISFSSTVVLGGLHCLATRNVRCPSTMLHRPLPRHDQVTRENRSQPQTTRLWQFDLEFGEKKYNRRNILWK